MTHERKIKYQAIYEKLFQQIRSGQLPPGGRLPGEHELCATFGASRVTVARAIRELQAEGLVYRIVGSGTYVTQEKSPVGKLFGLLIPELGTTEIFEPICQGMMHSVQAASHSLIWGNSVIFGKTKEEQAIHQCQHYIERKVDGVFFAPLEHLENKDTVNRRIVSMLKKAAIPIVLLDRCYLPYPERSAFDLVGIDNHRAAYMVTDHLLHHGCEQLVFLGVKRSANTVRARIAGFRDAVLKHGLSLRSNRIALAEELTDDYIADLLRHYEPDGFVCMNDMVAGQLMQALDRLGEDVPAKIRLAGMDDVRYAGLLRVPLTTIHQPCADIGVVALAAMLERLENPLLPTRDLLLPVSLIIRNSCGVSHSEPLCS
ncbi:MAG TPA: substrate-binding domain-containing protein [Granulicella sp.]